MKDSSYRSKSKSIFSFVELSTSPRSKASLCVPDEYDDSIGILRPSSRMHIPHNRLDKRISELSSRGPPPIPSKIHALIVDDCPVNRMVHHTLLSRYNNMSITEHSNGKEAVDYVNIIRTSNSGKVIIFMDINMPMMDGIEATKEIRKLKYNFPIAIIAVSAFSNERELQMIENCGIDTYITKPMTKEKMAKVISIFY